jgi:proton-translocating NAD(P)+ transhydrogenase subunit beta
VKTYFIEFSYLLASILFILGLRGMSHPETARRGMHLAEFGMVTAVMGTLLQREIISYEWIIAGLLLGSTIGLAMGVWVPMTAMPQRTALSHAFGALAASLVGISEYYLHGPRLGEFRIGALCFEVMLALAFVFGILLVLPIGAADMPVVISLLNSYAGLGDAKDSITRLAQAVHGA